MVPGILGSPAKEEHITETNGQNQETNIDVTESTVQAHQQQLVLSSPQSAHPSAPYQVPNASLEANNTPQQGSYNDMQNLSASQKSEVKSESTHSTHPKSDHTSSDVLLGNVFVCVLC